MTRLALLLAALVAAPASGASPAAEAAAPTCAPAERQRPCTAAPGPVILSLRRISTPSLPLSEPAPTRWGLASRSFAFAQDANGWGLRIPHPRLRPSSPQAPAEADVVAAAEAALDGVWPDAEVRVVRLSGGAADAAPPLRVRFADAAPRGRVSAEVEAYAADGWTSAGWAFLEVAVFEPAPVLTADVSRGEPVADAVRVERVETTALRDVLAADALSATDWTASRSLRAGTVLTTRLVEAPAAAERGAPLRVRYERGAVTVTLACEARERGAVGETVRARCAATGATARVRLTAPGAGDWAGSL